MDTTSSPSDPLLQSDPPASGRRRCHSAGGWYIAATVFAFIVFWPIGLAMLIWAIWGDRMKASRMSRRIADLNFRDVAQFTSPMNRRPDNMALAEYLEREQQRLRTEQEKLDDLLKAFDAFKAAEQRSKDQRDFDEFLKQREPQGPAGTAAQSNDDSNTGSGRGA